MRIFGLIIASEKTVYEEALDLIELGISVERDRVIDIVALETRHGGKTHYEGSNCQTCRILHAIEGETGE
jgi:hypothetical protein